MLILRQAETVGSNAEGNAADRTHRLIIGWITDVGIADHAGCLIERRADPDALLSARIGAAQFVNGHGDKTGGIRLADVHALRVEMPRRDAQAPFHLAQAQHGARLRVSKRQNETVTLTQRRKIRQEDGARYALALLRKAGNRFIHGTIHQLRGIGCRVQHDRHVGRALHPVDVFIVQRHRHVLRKPHGRERIVSR